MFFPELCWLDVFSKVQSSLSILEAYEWQWTLCIYFQDISCLLFMVDWDIDTSRRVLFTLLVVVKGFLFTMEMILRSSTTVVFHRNPALFVLLSSPVLSLFLRMYQTVNFATPNIVAISRMDLLCLCSLRMACFTCMENSFDCMLSVHSTIFHIQAPHLKSAPGILSA